MAILNFNLGVLGHVDSGKTTLVKALSSIASTACFDKNPQSKERGITLDLGFSSFSVDLPEHVKDKTSSLYTKLQFTLVDCPGHASLIKTIIGGAQIIDMMLLVIDITKGMQTQTAECLVIGEITCNQMIVVLNKIDLIPNEKRQLTIDKMIKKIQLTLRNTKFHDCTIVPVSAYSDTSELNGISNLIETLKQLVFIPKRDASGSFLFSVDHCFPIKGQGTVMTGTVLQGKISVNDAIEIPMLKLTRKVKSMQMFHQAVDSAIQGDRLGICVTQFDPKLLERGIACTPGALPMAYGLIVNVDKVVYYKQIIKNKTKYHITLGHETVMARIHLFQSAVPELNFDIDYEYCDEIAETKECFFFAVLEFDYPVPVVPKGLIIGSKFDTDIHSNTCRIAFKGNILFVFGDENYRGDLARLKVYKTKVREGVVERMTSDSEVIGRNLVKKETNVQPFVNLKVTLSTGEKGIIEGSFGQSGKVKIRFMDGLKDNTRLLLSALNKKKKPEESSEEKNVQVKIFLSFKRYVYDPQKKIIQT
uniref:Selenocysteine-specific elongation factor n=1 Tax=Daphnia galeata TaxID=27404 RepID=A0A8J2REW1_9CRUS|nr:unnamed protein product [Daphnia galeata]